MSRDGQFDDDRSSWRSRPHFTITGIERLIVKYAAWKWAGCEHANQLCLIKSKVHLYIINYQKESFIIARGNVGGAKIGVEV